VGFPVPPHLRIVADWQRLACKEDPGRTVGATVPVKPVEDVSDDLFLGFEDVIGAHIEKVGQEFKITAEGHLPFYALWPNEREIPPPPYQRNSCPERRPEDAFGRRWPSGCDGPRQSIRSHQSVLFSTWRENPNRAEEDSPFPDRNSTVENKLGKSKNTMAASLRQFMLRESSSKSNPQIN